MAEVYRAEQGLTGGIVRPAALKVIRPEYSESPDFREMFLDEARLACTLSHPNIVHIYEVGEAEGRLYMAMELVPGESLAVVSRALRENGERFSLDALIAVGLFTCSALEAVHVLRIPEEGRINLVHRDVSPHNLLLGPGGSLKLIDFGIAKAASNRNLTSPGVTKGKAGYFSPEQAMGKQLDGRSDLFSLGVTLYKLAWGGTPFDQHKTHHERNTALVHGRWVPLRDVCPGLPSGFYDIVDCALQVRPENRFPDAYEMRVALERLAVESGIHVGPSTLSGYVAPQADDPQGLGARGNAPTRSRPSPIVDTQAATVAGANQATAAASPAAPRRQTEKLEARHVLAGARPRPSRRQWLIASGAALVLIAVAAGLWLGKGTFPASGMQVTRESPAVPEPPSQRQQEPERLAVPEPPPATVASSETSKPVARSRSSRPELKRTPRPEPVAAPALLRCSRAGAGSREQAGRPGTRTPAHRRQRRRRDLRERKEVGSVSAGQLRARRQLLGRGHQPRRSAEGERQRRGPPRPDVDRPVRLRAELDDCALTDPVRYREVGDSRKNTAAPPTSAAAPPAYTQGLRYHAGSSTMDTRSGACGEAPRPTVLPSASFAST